MIHRAKFQNFKALRDVEVTFDSRLTVLVGPNGSGKTSVLQGLEIVCRVVSGGGDGSLPHPPRPGGVFSSSMSMPQVGIENLTELAACRSSSLREFNLTLGCWMRDGRGGEVAAGIECSRNSSRDEVQKRFVNPPNQGEMFSRALLLRLDPALLASPSIVTSNPPLMHPSGAGLPSTLAYTALNQPDDFKLISDALRVVIPAIDRIRFDKKLTSGSYGDGIIFDFRGAPSIGAAHASNGTLCALGLLTSILGPDRPRLVLLDDLDHGLHPKAQMELIGVLRALLARFPDLQIIATSHSPYILNQLAWNEVRVTGLRDDGSAICARLEDHPEVERWREAMTPGEFWSHIGDDWVKKLDKPQTEQPQPTPVAL